MHIFIHLDMSFSIEPSPTVQGVYGNPVYFNCTLPVTWKYIHFKIKHEVGYKFALFSGGHCKVPRSKADQYTVSCHGNTFTLGILRPEDNKTWECTYKDGNSTKEQFGGTTIDLQPGLLFSIWIIFYFSCPYQFLPLICCNLWSIVSRDKKYKVLKFNDTKPSSHLESW